MYKLLLLTAFLGFAYQSVEAQIVDTAFSLSGLRAYDVVLDAQDNQIIAGFFDEANTPPYGFKGIVQKRSPDGTLLWTGQAASNFSVTGSKACVDTAGNVYVTGHHGGDFGSGGMGFLDGPTLNGPGLNQTFLVKYNPDGVLQWALSFGGAGGEMPKDIGCDANGNVVIIGECNTQLNASYIQQVYFGSHTITTNSSHNNYIVKVSATGTVQWAKLVNKTLTAVAVSDAGEIAIAGIGELVINNVSYTTTPGAVIAKLDANGVPVWTKSVSNPSFTNSSHATAINFGNQGDVYACGGYTGAVNFAGASLPMGYDYGNAFIMKFDSQGVRKWHKTFIAQHIFSPGATFSPHFYPIDIISDAAGNSIIAGYFGHAIKIGAKTFTATEDEDIFVGKLDSNGNLIWGISGGGDYSSANDLPTSLAFDSNNRCYMTANFNGPVVGQTIILANDTSNREPCLLYRITTDAYNQISGTVFYDENSNSVKDSAEAYATNIVVKALSPLYYANSNEVGRYDSYVYDGGFTVLIPAAPLYYTVVPGNHSGSFSGFSNSDSTRHFALQPIPGMQDLRVTVTPTTVPRPGFAYPLHVTYRNIGTTTLTGSVELQLDSLLVFQNSAPAQNSVSGNTLTWNFTNLQPTQSATILVNTHVPATAVLGTTIDQLASVSPLTGDLTPADNTDLVSATVVGSYDPNDKQVNHTSLTPTQVQNQEWLEYTIRFQNTGTDTAFTVRLADTLSTMLNIPSIELLASSHPNTWSIKGAGIMEFRFDNILLPDSNTNEPASHGFVKYRIKPQTTLALGDVIENTAYIYFDFNAPIVTNTATTEVKLLSSIATLERNPLHIYPNPNKGEFTLQCSNIWASQVQAEMRNVLGQTVWQQNLAPENGKLHQVINTTGLPKAVYYLQLKTEKGSNVQKVVID